MAAANFIAALLFNKTPKFPRTTWRCACTSPAERQKSGHTLTRLTKEPQRCGFAAARLWLPALCGEIWVFIQLRSTQLKFAAAIFTR
jgi:hypothetical protein